MHCILAAAARPECLNEALASGASIVVADLLAGSDPPGARRAAVGAWLRRATRQSERPALFVRPHPIDSGMIEDDLDGLAPGCPEGILLACPSGARDLQQLGAKLAVREVEQGLPENSIGILALVASAAGTLALAGYPGASRRLRGIVWDADAMIGDLGLPGQDLEAAPLKHSRAMTLLAARAAGVAAIETIGNPAGRRLAEAWALGRRDGFAGALTRDPAEVGAILAAYRG